MVADPRQFNPSYNGRNRKSYTLMRGDEIKHFAWLETEVEEKLAKALAEGWVEVENPFRPKTKVQIPLFTKLRY